MPFDRKPVRWLEKRILLLTFGRVNFINLEGHEKLRRYISGHLRYPGPEAGKEIEGKAVVRLAVMSDGSVGEVRIARSLDPYLDKEAVRVVSEMPRWIPGRHEGKAVNVWVVLPVEFARDASGGLRLK